MKKLAIGASPHVHTYTVNDVTYEVVVELPDPPALRVVWRVKQGEASRIAGTVHLIHPGCWYANTNTKCWRSMEQAVVEVAKADQGVTFAR